MISKKVKIFLTGHNGLVGSSILKKLKEEKYENILFEKRKKLNLLNENEVSKFLRKNKPDIIIHAAAKVGGILENSRYPAEFIYENSKMQNNIIHHAYLNNIKKIIFLGSSCIYPKLCRQPIKESYLLSGYLEKTNEAYALAKILGIKMCESYNKQFGTNYLSLMPCNVYGPNDNFDLLSSHFFPALIKKIYLAKKKKQKNLIIWGNGKAKRELIHCDDLADAVIYFMKKKTNESLINIGSGVEKTINEYAKIIMKHFNIKLKIIYDKSKPNGTPRKKLNISRAKSLGWKSKISLKDGIKSILENKNLFFD